MQASMSLRLPEEISNELAELSKATGRTKSFLKEEYLEQKSLFLLITRI